ncbi:hypothetical protein AgCh_010204 [Apium graveolens]
MTENMYSRTWCRITKEEQLSSRTYAQDLESAVGSNGVDGMNNNKEGELQVVQRKKNKNKVLDIILPRKRNKRGKRFGFVKTTSELKAGTIILNAKEKGGLCSKIKMSLNERTMRKEHDVWDKKMLNFSKETVSKQKGLKIEKDKKAYKNAEVEVKHKNNEAEKELGVEMFGYIEAIVDKDI